MNDRLLKFIENSPSCFHVIENLQKTLLEKGYCKLAENMDWNVEAGGKYFVTRNDSSLIAFQVPEKRAKGFHIVASHSDSPTFKIKENPVSVAEQTYLRLNTEKYGGMILSTWLDRPLSIAGRVVLKCEDQIVTRLVDIDRDLLVIPNVAIHMNREMNKGMEYNPQTDMLPLAGVLERAEDTALGDPFLDLLADSLGVSPESILGHDLFLYVRDKGRILGRNGELILSPRLDDLQCVFASLEGFLDTVPGDYISMCAVFDNEEVGSGTRQGADSTFLEDVMYRICKDLKEHYGEKSGNVLFKKLVADSFLISADNAHAIHPNHPEKGDPTNRPYLNGGIVIKYHGSQKYTTDAVTGAKMKNWCNRAGVPFQTYCNRSDIVGGSTLGNISTAHVSLPSVDIGLPQLAMHSAVETAGSRDTEYAVAAMREFFAE